MFFQGGVADSNPVVRPTVFRPVRSRPPAPVDMGTRLRFNPGRKEAPVPDRRPNVEHVIVLMMENRSFDHLFGFLDRPGLEPLEVGTHPNPLTLDDAASESFPVKDAGDPSLPVDPPHSYKSVVTQLHRDSNGENDGFVAAYYEKASGKERIAEIRWVRIGALLTFL